MKFITEAQHAERLAIGYAAREAERDRLLSDPKLVVKLIHRNAYSRWLLIYINPKNGDCAYGLCDLGIGRSDFGLIGLIALGAIRDAYSIGVELDSRFVAESPVPVYAEIAYAHALLTASGSISENSIPGNRSCQAGPLATKESHLSDRQRSAYAAVPERREARRSCSDACSGPGQLDRRQARVPLLFQLPLQSPFKEIDNIHDETNRNIEVCYQPARAFH
jgi:hypothetical protein